MESIKFWECPDEYNSWIVNATSQVEKQEKDYSW